MNDIQNPNNEDKQQNPLRLVRLQKYMADQGIASRRKSEEFIAQGMVKVNGETVTEMGVKVDPEVDKVEVNNAELNKVRKTFVYIKINKPVGYECTTNPPEGSRSILELVEHRERLFTVGRLDKASEGLILLTNDGALTNKLTHPKYSKEKEYEVTAARPIYDDELDRLSTEFVMLDRRTRPAEIQRLSQRKFSIILKEGMNRQIRRMCRKLELRIHKLKRVRIGRIYLDDLEPGEWKTLKGDELKYIYEILERQV